MKITNIGHGYFSGPLYVATELKLFEKYGLEPQITYVQGGPLALQSVLTKQADVGILSYEHVLTVAAQGKRIVAFAVTLFGFMPGGLGTFEAASVSALALAGASCRSSPRPGDRRG